MKKTVDNTDKRCYTIKVAPNESTEEINLKKGEKKYLTKERQSDIIDKLSKGAAVMFEN